MVCRQLGYDQGEFYGNLLLECSHIIRFFIPLLASIVFASYPNLSKTLYHLHNINCRGDENFLTECTHNGFGVHRCSIRSKQTGVFCNGRLNSFI